MNNVTIDLTEQQLTTVISALKIERFTADKEGRADVSALLTDAIEAIYNQPWKWRK